MIDDILLYDTTVQAEQMGSVISVLCSKEGEREHRECFDFVDVLPLSALTCVVFSSVRRTTPMVVLLRERRRGACFSREVGFARKHFREFSSFDF